MKRCPKQSPEILGKESDGDQSAGLSALRRAGRDWAAIIPERTFE
jgi:hypothetical protein